MPSRSFPGRAASSTSTSTEISSSRRRCWGTTRSPTTSCRSSASASPDPGRRLSPGPGRTPSRWRLRPPPPQAFRLASRLPRTTRRRGFNLEALRARCSTTLRQGPSGCKTPLTRVSRNERTKAGRP
jgi:hypothetical protein